MGSVPEEETAFGGPFRSCWQFVDRVESYCLRFANDLTQFVIPVSGRVGK